MTDQEFIVHFYPHADYGDHGYPLECRMKIKAKDEQDARAKFLSFDIGHAAWEDTFAKVSSSAEITSINQIPKEQNE